MTPRIALACRHLPVFQFRECHGIDGVRASPESILDAIEIFDASNDRVLAAMLALRELPSRTAARFGRSSALIGRGKFGLHEFTRLERTSDGIAFGLAGRFWRPDFGLEPVHDSAGFAAFRQAGAARLVMAFQVNRDPITGTCAILTETRVQCHDATARRLFTPYWFAIRPGSGFIRRRLLAGVRKAAESGAS